MAPTAPADLVEWRVFLPTPPAAATAPLSSILLGELFQAWPVEAEGGVEDRTDRYLLVGSDGVGLKHRGKKGKLEVKVLTTRWEAADSLGVAGGVEAWVKYKLGKEKGQGKGSKGHKGDGEEEGEGGGGGGGCIGPAQHEELERVLADHRLLDARVQRALQQGSGGTTRGGGGRLEEVAVTKSRLVGRLRLGDALADVEGEHGGGGGSSIAQRLLQRVTGSSPHPPTPPAGLDLDAELLVEDCVLEVEVEADGGGASAEASEASGAPRRWRSYQVEGSRAEVLHFLTATPLGRAMHAFAAQPGAVVAGYPAWLGRVARWGQEEDASSSCAAAVAAAGEGTCAAMIARVTASKKYPIPPLPPNPHGGVKEQFKLKQVALVVVRHPSTGKYLAVEEQHDKGWWLPAGHVDPNETFAQAAYRETLEEAGIGIKLQGILRVEHKLTAPTKGRLRVVYYGAPIHPEAPLKSVPDEESRSARWVTRAELLRLPLRSQELVQWIDYLEAGGAVYPLSLFAGEHEPVPVPGSS